VAKDSGSKVTRAFHLYVGHSTSAVVCLLLWVAAMVCFPQILAPWIHLLFFPMGFFIGCAVNARNLFFQEEHIQRYSPSVTDTKSS